MCIQEKTRVYMYILYLLEILEGQGDRNFSKLPERRNVLVGKESDQHYPATIEARSQRDVERLSRERSGVRNLRRDFIHQSEKRQK